jgi:hypothetical protein
MKVITTVTPREIEARDYRGYAAEAGDLKYPQNVGSL